MTMLTFRKGLNALVADEATHPEAAEWLRSLKLGTVVTVERPKKPRNPQHARLWWALINLVFENQERYETKEAMVVALKVALGHCDTLILKNGQTAFLPKSISFHAMDQNSFAAFFDKTVALITKHFLPGVDDAELRKQVEEMVA